MVFILQYKKSALGCSLCYRKNIDKPQLSSVSGTIFTLQVPILGSGSQISQKWGVPIRSGQNPKIGGGGAANPTVGKKWELVWISNMGLDS